MMICNWTLHEDLGVCRRHRPYRIDTVGEALAVDNDGK